MFSIRITCCALCFLFLLLPPTRAQQLPSVLAGSYPDSPEGLRKLMGDLVAAAKTNSKRESQLVASLRLPDAASWFADVFGPDNGATLAASYQRSATDLNQYAKGLFGYCAKVGINEIAIERLGTPGHPIFSDKILASMVHSAPLYRVSFRTENMEIATSENYVYVQGGFRRVDDDVFMSLPGMPTRRIRLGEHVLLPKVPTIKPTTPTDAAGKPMHGRVRLLVRMDVKGDVKEVKLEKGDPLLGQAAADAVRQWHFEPFTINGNPTEVETWVSVKFP